MEDDEHQQNGGGTATAPTTIREMGDLPPEDDHPVEFKAPEQLSLNIGGRKPDTSKVSIKSIGREVEGTFKQDGELVPFLVWARLDETKFTDKHDAGGKTIGRTRTAVFTPENVKPLPAELVERFGL